MTPELLKAVVIAKLTDNQAIDLLQEAGVISDLCLKLSDIADEDCAKAIGVLRFHSFRRPKVKGAA